VTFSGTITAGTLNFDSAHAYSIIPSISASQLHLNVASGSAAVNVASGNHSISGLHLDDPTTFNVVQPTSTLTVSISSAAGQPINKQGQGTLAVNRLISGAVAVAQGTLVVNGGGTSGSTSRVPSLSIATGAGAKLDLANNDMVVPNTPVGGWNGGSAYTGLSGLIAQAYVFGEWSGPGLTSSNAAASQGVTTLAIAPGEVLGLSGSDTALWSGQSVDANDALVAYTYAGDLNMDGLVDAADYGVIDNWVQFPGTTGYHNGDFNYDGVIDAGDYGIIDNSIQLQGAPLIPPLGSATSEFASAGAMSGVSAVPEPASMSLVAIASVALLARRRRRAN
jgi:hypothetical protein